MATAKGRDDWRKNAKTMDGLRRRYSHLHPLLLQRTIERAGSGGEVFDILEAMPAVFPLLWADPAKCWAYATDMWLEPGNKSK